MPQGEELPDDIYNHVLAERYHISPLEVEGWPYLKRQRYLALTNEIEAGVRDRQAIESFRQGGASPGSSGAGTGDEGGGVLSPAELKALQEESETKYGRWQS